MHVNRGLCNYLSLFCTTNIFIACIQIFLNIVIIALVIEELVER